MNLNIITYIATVVAGVFFIVCREGAVLNTANWIAALIFIIPGIINFVAGLRNSRRNVKGWTATFGLMPVSAGAVALGVLMLAFPTFFLPYVAITLGVVLVLCGVFQLVAVLRGGAKTAGRRWFIVMPLLAMASGIVLMVLQDKGMTPAWWIVTGSVLITYGINGFVAMAMLKGDKKDAGGTVIVR